MINREIQILISLCDGIYYLIDSGTCFIKWCYLFGKSSTHTNLHHILRNFESFRRTNGSGNFKKRAP